MLELVVEKILSVLIPLFELMGIAVITVSTLTAFGTYLKNLFTHSQADIKFRLATGMALSLEFKMAAEILKTVLVHEQSELITLGAVIVLRALLSFLIHFEMKHMEEK